MQRLTDQKTGKPSTRAYRSRCYQCMEAYGITCVCLVELTFLLDYISWPITAPGVMETML